MACYWGNYCAYEASYAPTITYYVQPTVHYQYVTAAVPATPCCCYQRHQQPVYVSSCAYQTPVAQPAPSVCPAATVRHAAHVQQVLPSINYSCYAQPTVMPCDQERHFHYQEPTIMRNVDLNFYDTQTVVRDNNNHYTHHRTVVTNVNRHHYHTQRIITNENNYNTYLTNNVIRVNDIHHQRVENVEGEKRVFNDYKQTETVEPAKCVLTDLSSCESSN